ncbi:MAG: peptidylprolyl isomerase [Gemmatimonadales bacterium]
MRRLVIPSLVLTAGLMAGLGGCSNFRDLFSAHAETAAEAGGQELTSRRLAEILAGGGKGAKLNRESAAFVANIWVDYALFGQAVARGKLPTDSVSVAEAVWPELSELKGTHWHDTLLARRGTIPPSSIDSLYNAGDVRVLQHILFGVRPNSDSATRKAAKQKAEATLAKVQHGANFGQLASQLSQDPGSKADSGYLPPSPKGRFVPAFDSAGWGLQPGQVSGVVETAFGYHILKRPSLSEARPRIASYLTQRAAVHLDSLYMDSLAEANKIEVLPSAPANMRTAATSPDDARNSSKPLVHYRGGQLTLQDYVRWIRALPPQYTSQLKAGDDSMLIRFARILTQNVLLLRQADSAKITVTPDEWAMMKQRYQTQLDTLKGEMGLDASDVTSSAVSEGDRDKVAELKVDRYFDQLIAGKQHLRPLPSALATLLRDRLPYRVYDAGVGRSVEIATELKAKADTGAPRGAMQPATGPAPVPGARPVPAPADSAKRPESAKPTPGKTPETPKSSEPSKPSEPRK